MFSSDRRNHRGHLHEVRGESKMRIWQIKHDMKILEMLDDGIQPKKIASELNITVWAVYKARSRMFDVKQKMDVVQKLPKQ